MAGYALHPIWGLLVFRAHGRTSDLCKTGTESLGGKRTRDEGSRTHGGRRTDDGRLTTRAGFNCTRYLPTRAIRAETNEIDRSIRFWCQMEKENSNSPVTDKEMVDLGNTLQGWCKSVYKFGCAFIHLSNMHDYNDRDPLALISAEDREDMLGHCRAYHGGPNCTSPTFSHICPRPFTRFQQILIVTFSHLSRATLSIMYSNYSFKPTPLRDAA